MRRLAVSVVVGCLLFTLSGVADAGLLGLTPQPPDVCSVFTYVQYTASSGAFRADGYPAQIKYGGGNVEYLSGYGLFDLDATITGGLVATSGSLLICKDTELDGVTPIGVVFRSSVLTGFGYGGNDLFEFKFAQQSEEDDTPLASDGTTIGVILSASQITWGAGGQWDFGHNFHGDGFAYSDTFPLSEPVPEPPLLLLMAMGATGLMISRRRVN